MYYLVYHIIQQVADCEPASPLGQIDAKRSFFMKKNSKPILLPQSPQPGFDKPFIEYPFQLARLDRRGLTINQSLSGGDAISLRQHGYYQIINGYGTPFEHRDKRGEKRYNEGTSFADIYTQYFLDKELGKLLFSKFLDFEEHFKVAIGYSVSRHFGVNNYRCNDNDNHFPEVKSYLDISFYPGAIAKPTNELHSISLHCTKNPTKWYRDNMNHIPPWILLMNATEWQTNSYYLQLPSILKNEILSEMMPPSITNHLYGSSQEKNDIALFFYSGLELVRGFRNHIAHNIRMYDYQDSIHFLNITPLVLAGYPNMLKNYEFNKGIGRNDLFALLIWLFVCSPTPDYRSALLGDLEAFYSTPAIQKDSNAKYFFHHESKLPLNFITRLEHLTRVIE